VLIIAAFSILILCLAAALTVDGGYLMCTRAELQNAADAGCAAAVQELMENSDNEETTARELAATEGQQVAALNHSGLNCSVVFGRYADGQFQELDTSSDATAVRVRVARDESASGGPVAMLFAPVLGVDTTEVRASTVASFFTNITGILSGSDLRPFALDEDLVDGWGTGETVNFDFPDQHGSDYGQGHGHGHSQVAPGNWGWLNLDGGSCGANEQRDWILNGYDGDIRLDQEGEDGRPCTWIDGSPGVRASLHHAFEQICGQTVLMCVFDRTNDRPGSNCDFRIVGFVALTLENIQRHGSTATITATMEGLQGVPYCETGSGGYAAANANVGIMQIVE
jgi:Flp pilus assembly protein TadG